MKTIREIRLTSSQELEIHRIEKMIRMNAGTLSFITIHESEALTVDEIVKELESADYVIFMKKEDHVVIDLIESQIKQENEDEQSN